ncbi:60S ribosomal protein L7 [Candida albicans P57072]|uniref:Rpl7p n=2 Tax=Candida albicans TaxID=5476 RepID=Q59V85_CANAL|nr:Rpl7p [Candida albicans SC5314]KGQ81925.1 60S ribosomal protein L7 [Candida albicans P94015]KGQ83197.1 60S ribosomal protein L7 [Candida albicans P37005]KGR02068.1 60S ribosomal protein L7 [Candida albicans P57072]KGR02332.1 60S ribosomal protein L7 [Candida albicans P78048]KGR06083.1 60S ribosomal protein L7 [Candida albicans P37037]KGT63834.1 60S ribosomal protein L7 [Candida albicans 12C]KGU02446.1 60S ribosomal protein L7 [Candida albicans L26]KGU02703.1 60S ribosomal protein L7 [Can|eukprot:XP_441054.1 Rpl7p [Candida albicans SC5314]
MAILNSNPEVLLRKRKNADRKRIEKQEQIRERQLNKNKLKKKNQNKFIRAETLVSNHKSNELERKRIKSLIKKQKQTQQQQESAAADSGDAKLLFLIRIPNHTKGLKLPSKVYKILKDLKLTSVNTGTFVKADSQTMDSLKFIAPYVLVGQPSLTSIRKLFQKRARIMVPDEEQEQEKTTNEQEAGQSEDSESETKQKIIKLDNNQLVEDKFGNDLGLICIEDLIHEISQLSDNFNSITNWLLPFQLNAPVNGWGPQAKLARLLKADENKQKISLAQDFKLQEVEDIDKIIDEQN